jgi:hypothetical protein
VAAQPDRAFLTGTFTQSHTTTGEAASTAPGYGRRRTDLNGAISAAATPTITVFGSIGRTVSARDPGSATLLVSAGASFTFHAWRPGNRPRR